MVGQVKSTAEFLEANTSESCFDMNLSNVKKHQIQDSFGPHFIRVFVDSCKEQEEFGIHFFLGSGWSTVNSCSSEVVRFSGYL